MTGVPRYVRPAKEKVLGLPSTAWTVILGVGAVGVVELVAHAGPVTRLQLVPVETMLSRAGHLLTSPSFLESQLLRSLLVIVVSFAVASVLGTVLALAMHSWSWARRAIVPFVGVYYAIPTFALYPVIVVMFGVGALPIAITSAAFAVVIIMVNVLQGLDSVPPVVDKLARSLRLRPIAYARLVLFPTALPAIATGLKLGLSYSIIAVLATEFILSTQGVGWYISQSYNNFAIDDMYGAMVVVIVVAFVANAALALVLNRVDWRRR